MNYEDNIVDQDPDDITDSEHHWRVRQARERRNERIVWVVLTCLAIAVLWLVVVL